MCVDPDDRARGRGALAEEDAKGRESREVDTYAGTRHERCRTNVGDRRRRRLRSRRPFELCVPVELGVVDMACPPLPLPLLVLRLIPTFVALLLVVLLTPLFLIPFPARGGALAALVLVFVGVVAPRVDRLLDLLLCQFALDGLDELVLRARAELAQQLLLCPVALVVEQLRDLVLLQPRAEQLDEIRLRRLRGELLDELRLGFRRHRALLGPSVQGNLPGRKTTNGALALRMLAPSRPGPRWPRRRHTQPGHSARSRPTRDSASCSSR